MAKTTTEQSEATTQNMIGWLRATVRDAERKFKHAHGRRLEYGTAPNWEAIERMEEALSDDPTPAELERLAAMSHEADFDDSDLESISDFLPDFELESGSDIDLESVLSNNHLRVKTVNGVTLCAPRRVGHSTVTYTFTAGSEIVVYHRRDRWQELCHTEVATIYDAGGRFHVAIYGDGTVLRKGCGGGKARLHASIPLTATAL